MVFLDDDEPTAKTCPECKGEGFLVVERGNYYRGEKCKWCKGTGRVFMTTPPMNGRSE